MNFILGSRRRVSAIAVGFIFLLGFFLFKTTDQPSATNEEESPFRAGPQLAVEEANLKDGFRMKEKAQKNIGLVMQKVESSTYAFPTSCLVYYSDQVGVYRYRKSWFKLIPVTIQSLSENTVIFTTSELEIDDSIVVQGVPLLRVSDMDAFGGEG